MNLKEYFQFECFRKLCRQSTQENVVYIPLDTELTLLELIQAGKVDHNILGVNTLATYLSTQKQLAIQLNEQGTGLFYNEEKLLDNKKLLCHVLTPFPSNFDEHPYEIDYFYPLDRQPVYQSYLYKAEDHQDSKKQHFENNAFEALRFINYHSDIVLETYIPKTPQDFYDFPDTLNQENLEQWGNTFQPLEYSNIFFPKIDIEFNYHLNELLEGVPNISKKIPLTLQEGALSTTASPFKKKYMRGDHPIYGKNKVVEVNRPFYLLVRDLKSHSVLLMAEIKQPLKQEKNLLNLINFKRVNTYLSHGLNIRGNLAVHYWCIKATCNFYKIQNIDLENYLNCLSNCLKASSEDFYKYTSKIATHRLLIYKKRQQKKVGKKAENYFIDWLCSITSHSLNYETESIKETIENYNMGLIPTGELGHRLGIYSHLSLIKTIGILLPPYQYFKAFFLNNNEAIGRPIQNFSFQQFSIPRDFDINFIDKTLTTSQKLKAFAYFKVQLWDMSTPKKLFLMTQCLDTYIKEQKVALEEWSTIKNTIQIYVYSPDKEQQLKAQNLLIELMNFERGLEKKPVFKYFNPQNQANINQLWNRHYLLIQLLIQLGHFMKFEATAFQENSWKGRISQEFLNTYIQSYW